MKEYVIINGVSSKTKTGLAINILPPITKPKMRTLIEEIDGRDGDIITKLGYSAYDKTIEIGLFGNGYDVDDIIAFFNQEGTIIFSNEPTKYYNFSTLDGFDIDRLLKFKKASITFHCQPFKYMVDEEPISGSDSVEITNNGNIYAKPILDIKGNGVLDVYLNNTEIFSVNITDEIIIDIENLETYNPNTGALMNRYVTGNISNFVLPIGSSRISVSGNVENIIITKYARWV